jgi:hypothetical protein
MPESFRVALYSDVIRGTLRDEKAQVRFQMVVPAEAAKRLAVKETFAWIPNGEERVRVRLRKFEPYSNIFSSSYVGATEQRVPVHALRHSVALGAETGAGDKWFQRPNHDFDFGYDMREITVE